MSRLRICLFAVSLPLLLSACFSLPSAHERAQMEQQQEEHCRELARQIREAQGKPLRRSTLERRFERECSTLPGCERNDKARGCLPGSRQ